jgi:hypothetical protein
LVLTGVIGSLAVAQGHHFPSPFDPASAAWFRDRAAGALVSAFFLFCSSVPLALYTATVTSRLDFLGMKVAGIQIALVGGLSASAALATAGFAQWTLAQPDVHDAGGVAHVLHLLSFAAAGPGFAVPFGLLIAGVSVVAGLQRFVSRNLMAFGLVLASAAELSVFALVWRPASLLLPVARFIGLIWMIAIGASLPNMRGAHGRSEA